MWLGREHALRFAPGAQAAMNDLGGTTVEIEAAGGVASDFESVAPSERERAIAAEMPARFPEWHADEWAVERVSTTTVRGPSRVPITW